VICVRVGLALDAPALLVSGPTATTFDAIEQPATIANIHALRMQVVHRKRDAARRARGFAHLRPGIWTSGPLVGQAC
jgi:hypothetical protein